MTKLLLIFCLLLFSCELAVDIDIPLDKTSLVVNAVFDPNNEWIAYVGQNRHILDTAVRPVNDALVVVYANNSPIDTLVKSEGAYYTSETKPLANVEYEIIVSAPEFEEVKARSLAPIPAQITEVLAGKPIYGERGSVSDMQIRFHDDAAAENYYELTLTMAMDYLSREAEITEVSRPIRVESNDLLSEAIESERAYSLYFNDIPFNGKEKTFSFQAFDVSSYPKSLVWTLKTISKDLYRYKTTVDAQRAAADNPFAQPVSIYNNITSGFGIFAGTSSSVYEDRKPKPVITGISPGHGKAGDVITITGENLFDELFFIQVYFSSQPASPNGPFFATPDKIVMKENGVELAVPASAITGKIYINSPGGIVASDKDFIVDE